MRFKDKAWKQLRHPLLLQHPFTTQHLPPALLTQLLDKASDPDLGTLSPEDSELEVKRDLGAESAWPGGKVVYVRMVLTCRIPAGLPSSGPLHILGPKLAMTVTKQSSFLYGLWQVS